MGWLGQVDRTRAALGVVLVAVSALVGAAAIGSSGDTRPVVVARADLGPGHRLEADDLSVVEIDAGSPLAGASSSSTSDLVGRRVRWAVPEGMVIGTDWLQPPGSDRSDGSVVAALALEPGEFAPGLAVGAAVTLVGLAVDSEVAVPGTVLEVGAELDGRGTRVVTLALASEDATTVVRANAADGVALLDRGFE